VLNRREPYERVMELSRVLSTFALELAHRECYARGAGKAAPMLQHALGLGSITERVVQKMQLPILFGRSQRNNG